MSDYYTPPPPPPPPHGSGGPPPPPPPPPGGGGYQGGPYQQGGQYQGGPHGRPEYPGGHYPPGGMPPGAPPKKRGMLPWILGCGGCALLAVIALVALGGIGYLASMGEQTTGAAGDSADTAGTTQYTATLEGLNEGLRERFVPFSFRYPEDWRVTERGQAADAMNFVKVEKSSGGTTAENFAVGYLMLPAGQENDPELIGQLLTQLEQQFAQQFQGFQRVGDDRATLGGRQATGFRFTSKQGETDIFGRVLLLPLGDGRGLSFVMLGTPVNSGLTSVDDLGEKGGLPVILRSFRIGEGAAAAGDSADESGGSFDGETPATPPADGATDDAAATTDDATPTDDAPPAEDSGEGEIKEIKPLRP